MTHHFTFFDWFISGSQFASDWQKLVLALGVGIILVLVASACKKRLLSNVSSHVVPQKNIGAFGILDFFVERFVTFHDSVLGKENRKFVPLNGTLFLFILLLNLVGLIPGLPAATATIWLNVGMALCVFVYFNYQGIKTHGVLGYLKHFAGPTLSYKSLFLVTIVVFCVEIFSTCLRVLTLNLRLYWNITADHMVLGVMTDLTKFGIPVIFYGLGTFVAFIQAFVFTLLTMVYLLLATQHSEGH